MAVVWRSTCAETRLVFSDGHFFRAVFRCLDKMYSTPSRLRLWPLAFGKTASPGSPFRSRNQWRKAITTSLRKGTQRVLRPLPVQRT